MEVVKWHEFFIDFEISTPSKRWCTTVEKHIFIDGVAKFAACEFVIILCDMKVSTLGEDG